MIAFRSLFAFSLFASAFVDIAYAEVATDEISAKKRDYFSLPDDFQEFVSDGNFLFNSRYRYELVEQDGIENHANANTIRTRFGYETSKKYDVSLLVEIENITDIGIGNYNNTINGKTSYPVVADIDQTHLNRAIFSYSAIPQTNINIGRQNIALGNQRWVGRGDWRQNDQTFDAITVSNDSLDIASLFYGYSNKVNRTLGERSPSGTWNNSAIHLFNANLLPLPFGKITGYSYLVDTPDSLSSSTATFGARWEGKYAAKDLGIPFALEFARQSDYAGNTRNFDLSYYSIEPSLSFGGWLLKTQYENIGGNGISAVQFPLATLHAFNGWADKMTTTPANGLIDMSIGVVYVLESENNHLKGIKGQFFYHDYSSQHGADRHYGSEWNLSLEQSFYNNYTIGIQYANYQADSLYTDTVKIMPYFQIKF